MHQRLVVLQKAAARYKWNQIHFWLGAKENVEIEMSVWQTILLFLLLRVRNWSYVVVRLEFSTYWGGTCIYWLFNEEKEKANPSSSPTLHLILSFLVSLSNIFCLVKVNFNCYVMKTFYDASFIWARPNFSSCPQKKVLQDTEKFGKQNPQENSLLYVLIFLSD